MLVCSCLVPEKISLGQQSLLEAYGEDILINPRNNVSVFSLSFYDFALWSLRETYCHFRWPQKWELSSISEALTQL